MIPAAGKVPVLLYFRRLTAALLFLRKGGFHLGKVSHLTFCRSPEVDLWPEGDLSSKNKSSYGP